ncbi:prisilkin-39-like isoform X1 [Harmonia axyridis]|uniref:prisilkin-39-like isoform X1 n=1 Tax=Harmonia axyridis TaxID=115357 RepID=UPI001E274ED9|nr:prisilkin-39-like isoform X1 [Harmonia axyridis]
MNAFQCAILIFALLESVHSYSKFGRKCDDIGCASNEECVMASKPCSYFDRKDECGEYPTCKKVGNGVKSCDNYVCPPSKVCKMDGGIPKCFDDSSKIGKVPLYDTSNLNGQSHPSGNYNPSAPSASGGSLYPNIRPDGNTHNTGYNNPGYQQPAGGVQRPMGNYGGYQQPSNNYGGYQQPSNNYGGYPASGGYPGYNNRPAGGYVQQNGGYGGYNRAQQQPAAPSGYYVAGAGYQQPSPNYGYGSNNNRYPNDGYGYSQGGYGNNNYGYNQNGQNRPKGNSGSSFTDSLKDALKKIGSDFLQKAVSGALKTN